MLSIRAQLFNSSVAPKWSDRCSLDAPLRTRPIPITKEGFEDSHICELGNYVVPG